MTTTTTAPKVEVTIDPAEKQDTYWMVWYEGVPCSPRWTQKGPAEAYRDMLLRGARKPEMTDAMRRELERRQAHEPTADA